MPTTLPPINYLAVLVSAVAIFMLGGAWYSKAMFAPKWMALHGIKGDMDPGKGMMGKLLIQAFICGLVISLVTAVLLNHFVNPTALRGALIGCLMWIGFAGPTSYSTAIFSMQSRKIWLIDTSYNLVSFVMAGVILGVWR